MRSNNSNDIYNSSALLHFASLGNSDSVIFTALYVAELVATFSFECELCELAVLGEAVTKVFIIVGYLCRYATPVENQQQQQQTNRQGTIYTIFHCYIPTL